METSDPLDSASQPEHSLEDDGLDATSHEEPFLDLPETTVVHERQHGNLTEAIENDDCEGLEEILQLDEDALEVLLDYKHKFFDANDKDTIVQVTPLALAAALQRVSIVEVLLKHAAPVHTEIPMIGVTALHVAARSGNKAIVELLVANGADINQPNSQGTAALHLACRYGHVDVVASLLGRDTTMRLGDGQQNTPFHIASIYGRLETLQLLWEKGPESQMHDRNMYSNQPLHLAALNDRSRIIPWLLENGASISEPGSQNKQALHHACAEGAANAAITLIENDAPIHERTPEGHNPLLLACRTPRLKVVRKLLGCGASVSSTGQNGNGCFQYVIMSSDDFSPAHEEVLDILVGNGADIDKFNDLGFSPLIFACMRDNAYIEPLLKLGANINLKMWTSCLLEASCNATSEAVDILLTRDPDMSLTNQHGLTALALACRFGRVQNVRSLIRKGAEVAVIDNESSTPLSTAATYDHIDVMLELLQTPAYYPTNHLQKNSFLENPSYTATIETALLNGFESEAYATLDQLYLVMNWAICTNRLELTAKCIAHDPEILRWSAQNATWLHIAALYGHHELIRKHLAEIDVSEAATGQITALHLASVVGTLETTQCLLEMVAKQSNEAPIQRKVEAILERNNLGESPLTLSIRRDSGAHKDLAGLFWSEIRALGDADRNFQRARPDKAREILETLAQYERPGHEHVLRHLLHEWSEPRRDPRLSALDMAVHDYQAVVIWWLLSKGGYSAGSAMKHAQSSAAQLKGPVGKLIQKMLEYPPPILDHIANPNDDQSPDLPELREDGRTTAQASKATIVDIYADGRTARAPYMDATIWDMIYERGPASVMENPKNLDHLDLDKLEEQLRTLQIDGTVPGFQQSDGPEPARAGHQRDRLRNSSHPGKLKLRWIHLSVNNVRFSNCSYRYLFYADL